MTGAEIAEKFAELESRIASERGMFVLFALFMREEAPDRWDLLVAAPWIGGETAAAVEYFVAQIKAALGEKYLISLSRIVVVDPQAADVRELNRTVRVQHGRIEMRDTVFSGLSIKHAYIITSNLAPLLAAA